MRARNIKPGFFKNEYLAEISPFARLLFVGLWLMSDKEGRLEYRPKRIKAELLPYDSVEIEKLLEELCNARDDSCKFVSRYEVDGGQFLFIHKFVEHQNPHKNEKDSLIPPFINIPVITGQVQNLHHTNPAESVSPILNPESVSLIPSYANHEKNEERESGIVEKIISSWNERSGCLPAIMLTPLQTERIIFLLKEKKEQTELSWWDSLFDSIGKTMGHLRGENDKGWKADLGWVVDSKNWANVINGRYIDREGVKNGSNRADTRKGNTGFAEARKSGETNWLE